MGAASGFKQGNVRHRFVFWKVFLTVGGVEGLKRGDTGGGITSWGGECDNPGENHQGWRRQWWEGWRTGQGLCWCPEGRIEKVESRESGLDVGIRAGGVYNTLSLCIWSISTFLWRLLCEAQEPQRDIYIDFFLTCFKKCAMFHFEQRAVEESWNGWEHFYLIIRGRNY